MWSGTGWRWEAWGWFRVVDQAWRVGWGWAEEVVGSSGLLWAVFRAAEMDLLGVRK